MNQPYRILAYLCTGLLAFAVLLGSCNKDEDEADAVELLSFGPSPALRGGELKIIGTGLDKVAAVVLPDNISVTSFNTHTAELITLTIPEETVEGRIILKTPQGDITSLTLLTISEPIVLASFNPEFARPGDILAIQGDYLNLIKTVIFSPGVPVGDSLFISQSKQKIEVRVPDAAHTGPIAVSNGEAMPIVVESEMALTVAAPLAIHLSPNPVKAGSVLSIEGADLDLARQIKFEGSAPVTSFVSQSSGKIEVVVPADAHDGKILMIPGSFIGAPSLESLIMAVPEIGNISPNPVKNGENISVTGADLDLVKRVTFGGNKAGAILGGGTAATITVKVPPTATEDVVLFQTAADKTVASAQILQLIKPSITGITPMAARFGEEITIEGNHLDLVKSVIFAGGPEATVNNASLNMATVDVPVGALTGPISVVTGNGGQVTSSFDFTILLSTNAIITSMPSIAAPGDMIEIAGEHLDELNEVIFPGEVPATMFGLKTATLIQVFVPMNTAIGVGNIKFITFEGEAFFSPPINIQGVDPVDDPALVFFNFDGLDSWWGDTGAIENLPSLSLDGSNYFHVNASLDGWTGFFWRNGGNNFPGAVIGANIGGYALKFDINVLEPITGGEFAWRLKGSDGDFWHRWKPWEASGSYKTNGWITVSIPLTEFLDGASQIPNLANITEDFGVAFNNGSSLVNACIDNVRFEEL